MNAKQFRDARHKLAHTQNSLGQFIGVTARHISRYESGEQKVPQSKAILMGMMLIKKSQQDRRHGRHMRKKKLEHAAKH